MFPQSITSGTFFTTTAAENTSMIHMIRLDMSGEVLLVLGHVGAVRALMHIGIDSDHFGLDYRVQGGVVRF
jgi:hypothetical protein